MLGSCHEDPCLERLQSEMVFGLNLYALIANEKIFSHVHRLLICVAEVLTHVFASY